MKDYISDRANTISPSLARKLFNMAKEYDDIIDLTLGDPDFDVPAEIKNAVIDALMQNKTHYSANSGLPEVRRAVANHIRENWGEKADFNSEIILTLGGMEALFLGLACLVNPEDEVIIFAPYYVNYVQMTKMLGGVPVIIDSYDYKKGMCLNMDLLEKNITDKTKAIIINTPNNPTGAVFDKAALENIARIAVKHDIFVISDEVYRTLIFDGVKHESILQFNEVTDRVLLIDSLSKEFCATGLRIGYAYGCEKIISAMTKMQENVAACATVPSQYAIMKAYSSNIDMEPVLNEFQRRRDFLYNSICNIDKLECYKPQGTFYLFVNIEATGLDSLEFAYKLLEEEHVAVVPGETYGESYKGYVRIAFTKEVDVLAKAVSKVEAFVSRNS